MKRSTASWTTAVAASALLAMPVGSWAQQPTPSTTPSQQTTAPAPQSGRTAGADMPQGAANEHLRLAQSALADIPAASLTGTTKTRVADLKKHINALEQSAAKSSGAAAKSNANWSKDVAAADRILSELLSADSATGAGAPATAGTSGSTATAPKTTTGSKDSASMTLDESARAKLQEVRTHLTAFAASMSGASSSAPSPSSETSASASASAASPASASASASPAGTSGAATATPAPTGTSGSTPATATPSEPTATPSTPADPAASASAAQATPQSPASTTAAPAPTPSQQVDAETVKRHLTAARDTLSELTQLPAAAQLSGDARTQISQLISNFNELITTNVDWRASYTKLQANLDALIGSQDATTAAATPAQPPATGTAGAVGTSGTTTIDPAVRAKLVEFRSHLADFEKAAGGKTAGGGAQASAASATSTPAADTSSSPAASASATPTADPSAAASTTTASPASASAAPSASASTSPSASSTASSTAAAAATPTGTSGRSSRMAQEPATAGTSGTGTPAPATEQATKPAPTAQASEGHREAMSHIDAIEAILNGKEAKAGSLDSAKADEIRTHLKKLREELSGAKK